MTGKKRISIRLSKELDDWVNEQIASGRFKTRTEAVDEALILLQISINW